MEEVVRALHQRYGDDIGQVALVLPSQRAGIYLKKHLSEVYDKPIWSPEILSVPEFVAELSGLQIIDPVSLAFEFYHVYSQQGLAEAHTFGQFVKWAPVLLNDFSEIDQYLTDTDKLFAHINEARAMDEWNPQGGELTDFQRKYLQFWDVLAPLYKALKTHLLAQHLAHEGLAARMAASSVERQAASGRIELPNQWQQVVFVGLNALTPAEAAIYKALGKAGLAHAYWDSDAYYLDDPVQEAGHFLRKYRKLLPDAPFLWSFDRLRTAHQNVRMLGVSGNVSQAKAAGDLLTRFDNLDNYEDTAVVLANEDLLVPVLQSLPGDVKHVNVTMGYPLRNAPLQGLWAAIFQLHENAARYARPGREKRFYYRDVLKVLNHPTVRRLPDGFKLAARLGFRVREGNLVFLSREVLLEIISSEELDTTFDGLLPIFGDWQHQPMEAVSGMLYLINAVREAIAEARKDRPNSGTVELEYLFMYTKVLNRITELSERYGLVRDLTTLRTLFNQVVGSHKVSFYGEPLRGLQVMGLLETRTLDFKNLVLLSANEDTLPTGKSEHSFLPYEVRMAFGLPTHRDRDALFAYHFYRLLQRAENVYLLYNTNSDTLGGGEKSRFLTQLEYELPRTNPNAKLTSQVLSMAIPAQDAAPLTVAKSPEVLQRISAFMQAGVSPSALNTFIRCPLDFYYSYLLRLPETEEVEETIEAATLGTIVHEVLEAFYEPFCGKQLSAEIVRGFSTRIESEVHQRFEQRFDAQDLSYGKNLLIIKVAIRFLENFLEQEAVQLETLAADGQTLTILATEQELDHELELVLPGQENEVQKVLLKGHADRIDQIGDTIRVIDYKTGKVAARELLVDDEETLFADADKRKSLQLFLYALLYAKKHENLAVLKLQSGIISFRNLSSGFMPVGIKNRSALLDADLLSSIESHLKVLIGSMYDLEAHFAHNEDSEYCLYCEV